MKIRERGCSLPCVRYTFSLTVQSSFNEVNMNFVMNYIHYPWENYRSNTLPTIEYWFVALWNIWPLPTLQNLWMHIYWEIITVTIVEGRKIILNIQNDDSCNNKMYYSWEKANRRHVKHTRNAVIGLDIRD